MVNLTKKAIKIDVVIPSVRPEELDFLSLLAMRAPKEVCVNFYIIIDHPGYAEFESIIDGNRKMTVVSNPSNVGAAASRNRGIDLCSGDYILFIDDDVIPEEDLIEVYSKRILENPNCPGFVGMTVFPDPINTFTFGVVESDILTFFGLSGTRKTVLWGTTSNLLISRDVIGKCRFGAKFPKAGGGEDIDFCLNILKEGKYYLETAPDAIVKHGWWNSGKRSYRRFFRWAYGDSVLPMLHYRFRYLNYPNLVETMVIFVPLLIIISFLLRISLAVIPAFMTLSLLAEFYWEAIRTKRIRPSTKTIYAVEGAIIRLSNDLGRLIANFSRFRISGFFERFDYFTTGESIRFERNVARKKFISFVITAIVLFSVALYKF